MKALTILQPWASAIALGHKRIETRGWQTSYRGPLLIHAGLNQEHLRRPSEINRDIAALCPPGLLFWLGAIIAVCELVGCVKTDGLQLNGLFYVDSDPRFPCEMIDRERALGDYTPGRFGWVLDNVRALPVPIPCRGKQGLWTPPAEVLAQITATLEGQQL